MKISSRWQTFFHALAFVLGFSLVFTLLGASVAFVGYTLNAWMPTIAKIGGIVLILFGLYVVGVFPWLADRLRATGGDKNVLGRGFIAFSDGLSRIMYTEGRVQVKADRRWGYFASFMMGIFFSAGWIPCIGPVLAGILLLAGDTQTVAQGALLLLVYSIGLGIPFLITGAALATVTPWLRKMNRYMGIVSKITGIFLIFIGVLLLADQTHLHRRPVRGALRHGAGQPRSRLHVGGDAAHRVCRRAAVVPVAVRPAAHPGLYRLSERDGGGR